MRYYELDKNGKVFGSYAVPQPEKILILLEDAPDELSMHDGEKWVPDTERVAAKAVIEKKAADVAAAKDSISAISADAEKADDFESLKAVVLALAEQVKILTQ